VRRPRGTGGLYQRGRTWWMAYRAGGRTVRESARTSVKKHAGDLLLERVRASGQGALSGAPLLVSDLRRLVEEDHTANGRASSKVGPRFTSLERGLGAKTRVRDVTADTVSRYAAARLGEGAARGTVNLELAWLRRALRLARRRGLLPVVPDFESLRLDNARRVFFDEEQFEAVRSRLPEDAADLVEFLWWSGWRRSEAEGLTWDGVDPAAQTVRIETSKTGTARVVPYGPIPGLVALIRRRQGTRDDLRARGVVSPWVFSREDGTPARIGHRAWARACRAAGQPGKTVHDLRRSSARRMVRLGVPQHVVMAVCGWKSAQTFRRYAIVDVALVQEALARAYR
jgi:integrase